MGTKLSRQVRAYMKRHERRCLLVGLDSAGKSTVLYRLHVGKDFQVETLPTVGFNVETVRVGKLTLNMWDVGGQDRLRPYWRHYFTGTQGVMFVVDSADRSRLELAREEFAATVTDGQLEDAAVLVLANKQDLPGAMSRDELVEALDLEEVCSGHDWHVASCVATSGEGLWEGIHWLCQHMRPV